MAISASPLPPTQAQGPGRFPFLSALPGCWPHRPTRTWPLSRYGQVSCALADHGGVVGILGPRPFKVRGELACVLGLLCSRPARLAGTLPFSCRTARSTSPPSRRGRRSERTILRVDMQAKLVDRADRGWGPGPVTHLSPWKCLCCQASPASGSFLPSFWPSLLPSFSQSPSFRDAFLSFYLFSFHLHSLCVSCFRFITTAFSFPQPSPPLHWSQSFPGSILGGGLICLCPLEEGFCEAAVRVCGPPAWCATVQTRPRL